MPLASSLWSLSLSVCLLLCPAGHDLSPLAWMPWREARAQLGSLANDFDAPSGSVDVKRLDVAVELLRAKVAAYIHAVTNETESPPSFSCTRVCVYRRASWWWWWW